MEDAYKIFDKVVDLFNEVDPDNSRYDNCYYQKNGAEIDLDEWEYYIENNEWENTQSIVDNLKHTVKYLRSVLKIQKLEEELPCSIYC